MIYKTLKHVTRKRAEQIMYKTAARKGHTIIKGNKGYYVYRDNHNWTDEPDDVINNPGEYLRQEIYIPNHNKHYKPSKT